jgi:hypothetical protein
MDLYSFTYPIPFFLQYELSIDQTTVSIHGYNPFIVAFTTTFEMIYEISYHIIFPIATQLYDTIIFRYDYAMENDTDL